MGIKFVSSKNTFKKIKCLDHAVGVLRYISCKYGQRIGRRDGNGLATHPHTHYARQPIDEFHRHERGKDCARIRNEISEGIASYLDLLNKLNWDEYNLHNIETCLCDRGKIGKEKRAAANEKRREFYKTEKGIAIKKKYREKAAVKRKILNQVMMLKVTKRAELCKQTIQELL